MYLFSFFEKGSIKKHLFLFKSKRGGKQKHSQITVIFGYLKNITPRTINISHNYYKNSSKEKKQQKIIFSEMNLVNKDIFQKQIQQERGKEKEKSNNKIKGSSI